MRWILLLAALGCQPETVCIGSDCAPAGTAPTGPPATTTTPPVTTEPTGTTPTTPVTTEPAPILTQRSCSVVVTHPVTGGEVAVGGEFGGWEAQPLAEADGRLAIDLGELEPGEYGFKFIYDGAWEDAPPVDVYTKWVDGVENRSLRVGDCTRPLLQAVSARATPAGAILATLQVATSAAADPVDPATLRVLVGDQPVDATVDAAGLITIDVDGLPPGKHSVRVWAADTAGQRAENEPLWLPLWVEAEPFEWSDALIYFPFVDRFRNSDADRQPWGPIGVAECADFRGGDLHGVTQAIEEGYFERLGVDTLWLSPLTDNPEGAYVGADGFRWYTGYHGYWPIDPMRIEDRLGDADADAETRLREVIAAAHARGIRVLFDLVLNHVHEDHVYRAEHPEWFGGGCVCGEPGCGWDERAVDCWFMPYLPDLNYKNPWVTDRVLDDTLALLERYDVDAVRIDAAKHMDHVVMRSLRKRLRDEVERGGGAPFYLVGETFTNDAGLIMQYVGDHELSGQFDFPLYYAIRDTFVWNAPFTALDGAATGLRAFYGPDALHSPFLGNHDIPRFASDVTGAVGDCWEGWEDDPMASGDGITQWDLINRASMGFAFTLTQPGAPLIYYGDEIGLHGGGDPDNRRMMHFDPFLSANQSELLARVQALGQARRDSLPLRRGVPRTLWVDDDLYVYALEAGGETAVVALNKGGPRTEWVPVELDGVTLTDATGWRTITGADGGVEVSLDSWEYAVFVR